MPNDCWCRVRIGADPEHIKLFCDTEFSFEKLRPRPESVDWYQWSIDNWGTKWDRYEYRLLTRGDAGIEIKFTTAWGPPTQFFQYLIETFHDVWLRCDWSEEGGMAGVFVSSWDSKTNSLKTIEESWEDWCSEEWHYRMQNDETEYFLHRPRSHCKDDNEYNDENSSMAIRITRGEERILEEQIKADYLRIQSREPNRDELRKELIRRKANQLWPEYASAEDALIECEEYKPMPVKIIKSK